MPVAVPDWDDRPVPGIHHLSLEVEPDLIAEETAFWVAIGFEPVAAPEGIGDRAVWMQAGGHQVHLLPTPGPTVPAKGHVALVADDFAGTVRALRKAGFEVVEGAEYWGSPRVKTTGPTGHTVELMQSPPDRADAAVTGP